MNKHIVDIIANHIEAGDEVSQEDVLELFRWAVRARNAVQAFRDAS